MKLTPHTTPHIRRFHEHESMLYGIAYRMLGSMSDAEDVVQDTWLRWQAVPLNRVESPRAYLASTTTRLCIDRQRRARVERLLYTGPWLPEPLGEDALDHIGPDTLSEKSEHISMAFMVMLEQLQPVERAVYILREAFDLAHDNIAAMLDIRPAYSRQLFRRARLKMQAPDEPVADPDEAQPLLERFLTAASSGNLESLTAMMHEDIVAYSDGGGRVSAALIPLVGPDKVATVMAHLVQKNLHDLDISWRMVNQDVGIVLRSRDGIHSTHTITLKDGLIYRLYSMRNPDKLGHVDA